MLDISRLVQKLAIRGFSSAELPSEIAKHVEESTEKHHIFGIKWSGVALLDELQLARVLLYAKIYRHHKVIAIEQMLRAVVVTLGQLSNASGMIRFLYSNADDVLLNMSAEMLAENLHINISALSLENKQRIEDAAQILKSIRGRRLWVRGFGLLTRYPADPRERDHDQKNGLINFREDIEHPQYVEEFRKKLLGEVHAILDLLSRESQIKLSPIQLESLIMIKVQDGMSGSPQIARAYLMPPTGQPILYREYTVNRAAWADSYLSDQLTGFIFCPAKVADAVYLAVEKLIRVNYGVRLPPSAVDVSKRDSKQITYLKKELQKNGYYKGTPYDLRPTPERLTRADVRPAIEKFVKILSRYQEPHIGETAEKDPIDAVDRAMNWLRQFDDDRHIDVAMRIMARFRMLTRDDTVNAVKTFIRENPTFKGARVIPFGSTKDSAVISTYFAADVLGVIVSQCTTLTEASRDSSDTPLIFIDDFIGSGGQGVDILSAGFGLDTRRDLGEQRSFFGDMEIELLKRVKVGFVFTAAWDAGVDEIRREATKLALDATVFRLIGEDQIPFAFENVENLASEDELSFKARCAEIGEALLSVKEDGTQQSKEKVGQRKLGYGNRAMLLASPFNVPSQTLTAIWANGNFDGLPWMPLMARRKKQ